VEILLSGTWKEKDILITVKTYPEYSKKYTETVCTCGILKDTGQMIRINPIKFRYLDGDSRFSKYQWIKAGIKKAKNDARPESYNINDESIELGPIIGTGKSGWVEREKWLLNENNVFNSVEELQVARQSDNISLGVVKPHSISRFKVVSKSENEIKEAELKKKSIMAQLDMLGEKQDLELLPYRFILHFSCDHGLCNGHEFSILDWEIAALYRKAIHREGWKKILEDKVMNDLCGEKRETYLILGNMAQHQRVFCILGFFWPPKRRQLTLSFDQ
jgi:hypothetical protein